MIVEYKYLFDTWDQFSNWIVRIGFVRYEKTFPCRRGYIKEGIDIQVSYYSCIKNRILIDGQSIFFLRTK